MTNKTTINGVYWILQHKTAGTISLRSLERTRFACYVAGSNYLNGSVAQIKQWGWRAIKVVLDYAP